MDFNETLAKLKEIELEEATLNPADTMALKKKEAAKQALLKAGKIKPGEDIALDPSDRTGNKYKVVPAQVINQAKRATVTR